MSAFLDAFPKVRYNMGNGQYSTYDTVTNITFRVTILKSVLNATSSYQMYTIRDGDTPWALAEKVYSDPSAYWIITYANDIYDLNYDWPLPYDVFNKYIIDKYGSVPAAMAGIHHYEKIVERTESFTRKKTVDRYIINYDKLTDNDLNVPYDYYLGLPETQYVEEINLNGRTTTQITRRGTVSNYDYENELNEAKREIKIIKNTYYHQIMKEFNNLTGRSTNQYFRNVS